MTEDEMVEGYLDGLKDERLELPNMSNYSKSYQHGWLNRRDDRIKKPRDCALGLRHQAKELLNEETP
jgi:predicted nucleotidyltransferase